MNAIPENESDINLFRAPLEVVDQVMKSHGMFALSDILSGVLPVDRFMTQVGVTDRPSFYAWLLRREGEMSELSQSGDDELVLWSVGHLATFKMVEHLLCSHPAASPVFMETCFMSCYDGATRRLVHLELEGRKVGRAADIALGNSAAWHSVLLNWRAAHRQPADTSEPDVVSQ